MHTRLWILAALVLATVGYLQFLSDVHAVPLRRPLSGVPEQLGEWTAKGEERISENVLANVGVEDYLMRTYRDPKGDVVSVYVGYYEQQREKDTIHSPKHCLPGAGWRPVENEVVSLPTPGLNGGESRAVRYVVESGTRRQVVLYWYQSRGRNITSEYAAKFWLVFDSMFRKRNDGALVRFMAPLDPASSPDRTQSRIADLAGLLLPEIAACLPE